jgi:hypothetical protein
VLRRRRCHRPRRDRKAGRANNRAATVTRAATAAAGDQPASSSDLAKDPEVLKVAAEKIAKANPVPWVCLPRVIGLFSLDVCAGVMSKLTLY